MQLPSFGLRVTGDPFHYCRLAHHVFDGIGQVVFSVAGERTYIEQLPGPGKKFPILSEATRSIPSVFSICSLPEAEGFRLESSGDSRIQICSDSRCYPGGQCGVAQAYILRRLVHSGDSWNRRIAVPRPRRGPVFEFCNRSRKDRRHWLPISADSARHRYSQSRWSALRSSRLASTSQVDAIRSRQPAV